MPAAIPKRPNAKWNPQVEAQVLADLESGLTLRQAAENNQISASLIIWKAIRDESFAKQYARAMEIRTDCDFEQLADMAFEEPERGKFGIDPAWVNLKRLQIDTIKWALSKRNPKKYGEKIQQEHSGELGIKVIAIQPGIEVSKDRPALKPAFDEKLIEGE